MELIQEMLGEFIKNIDIFPLIISSGLSLYIVPNTIRNFFIKSKNKQRNWTLCQQTPNKIPETSPLIKLLFDNQNIHNLEKILDETKYPKELTQL